MSKEKLNADELISSIIHKYVEKVNGIFKTLHFIMPILEFKRKSSRNKLKEKFGDLEKIDLKKLNNAEYKSLVKGIDGLKESQISADTIEKGILLSFMSEFENLSGSVLRMIYDKLPDKLHNEETLTFSDLKKIGSVKTARDMIVDRKIDSIIRLNPCKQIEKIAKLANLNIEEIKSLDFYNSFVEGVEMRNIFAHCDGVVSKQYIDTCNEIGIKTEYKYKDKAILSPKYFKGLYYSLIYLGVIILQKVSRKLYNSSTEVMKSLDGMVNGIAYEYLELGANDLAINILEWSCNNIKFYNEEIELYHKINLAIGYKNINEVDKLDFLLKSIDWSAKANIYKMAHSVLVGDIDNAIKCMKDIGKGGDEEDTKYRYKSRLIFADLRENKKFIKTYQKIFDEKYIPLEDELKESREMILSTRKKSK